jgi:hypothetical protein
VGNRETPGAAESTAPPSVEGDRPPRARPPRDAAALSDTPWAGAELDPAVAERGLRGLVGGGSSQVSPRAAMRARDAARPRPEDLARAEAELQVVRRHWTPRD